MLAAADYFVAGQPLKIKASTPSARLDEAMEYLVQNTFTKMGYLKHLSAGTAEGNPGHPAQQRHRPRRRLLLQAGENNPEALEDLRSYLDLCSHEEPAGRAARHDREAIRPSALRLARGRGVLLFARLIVLGEISLVMDGALLPIDKVYEPITTPAKRRKIVVRKRETADPKAIQNARSLGKELFAEMGPDGEDALFTFLQGKLKDWQIDAQRLQDSWPTPATIRARTEIGEGADADRPAAGRQGQPQVHRAVQRAEE